MLMWKQIPVSREKKHWKGVGETLVVDSLGVAEKNSPSIFLTPEKNNF